MRFFTRQLGSRPLIGGVVSVLTVLLPLLASHAEEKKNPFAFGLVDSPHPKEMWDKQIARPAQGFVLIRGWNEKKEEEELQEASVKVEAAPETKAEKAYPQNKEPERVEESRDSIIAIYGDPKEDEVIVPEQSAPRPFKAFHAAMQIGDEELAFDYARKWVRYLGQFQERMGLMQGLMGKAMIAEGISDGEDWSSSPEYDRFNKYVDQAIEEEKKENGPILDKFVLALPPEHQLRALTPIGDVNPALREKELQFDAEHRDEFRQYFKRIAPKSLDGVIKLELYVDVEQHKDSLRAGREMGKLRDAAYKNSKISFKVISHEYRDESVIRHYQRRAQLNGLEQGYVKYDEPQPKSVPMLKIIVPSLNQEFEIYGVRRGAFYEELISIIHGGPLS
ncbi:MAG: hypothetical protein KDD70_00745 [Bdellovibrionales bacterium]|nr:hypothetical protein [Bdellovibrionales bacterium]